ncbi:uncharacterized protein LOC100203232 isoform X1 [Hydra vulgaris]|uniref:Coiled-coil domain-containing protein 85A n=1 Tax=Hydra vulgaris TaxID=6087 RepID=T2M7H5_HYDVU|nr:uncharacterized protein LOC100203232 isoform X1 [Hydra vulgaris]
MTSKNVTFINDQNENQLSEKDKVVHHNNENELENNILPLSSELYDADEKTKLDNLSTFYKDLENDPKDFFLSNEDETYYLSTRLKLVEDEKLALMIDHNNLIKEFNKHMESYLEEIRNLKESKHLIEREAKELRDLCCLLDDERKKCRQLAKEWQRFGRHSVSVMRKEVLSYQNKINLMEEKQQEIMKENAELRDLCVYLDSQRLPNENQFAISYQCSKCSNILIQNNSLHIDKPEAVKVSDQIHIEQFKLKSSNEKKRVSFTFASEDDSDSFSTISEADSRLDFPPSFDSVESYITSGDTQGLLRNLDSLHRATYRKNMHSDISPRNSGLVRLSDPSLMSGIQVDELKEKMALTRCGKATLTETDITRLKDMCHIVDKDPSSCTSIGNLANLTSENTPEVLKSQLNTIINSSTNNIDEASTENNINNSKRFTKASDDYNPNTSDKVSFESSQLV